MAQESFVFISFQVLGLYFSFIFLSPSRGFEPGSVNFDKKSNGKDKFQTKALPTELRCQDTEWSNISLQLLM